MNDEVDVAFVLDGAPVTARVPTRTMLADLLRDTLGATGTKVGCEQGVCGACTVLVDGLTMRSCLMLGAQVDGAEVVTVAGIAGVDDDAAACVRGALARRDSMQCGFCTPGFVVEAFWAVRRGPMTIEETREALSGNVCRCTGYTGLVVAVHEASQELDARRSTS